VGLSSGRSEQAFQGSSLHGGAVVNHPFVRKLRHGACLSNEDAEALTRLAQPVRSIEARRSLLEEGAEQRFLPLIIEGWACRYKVLESGKLQIISLFVPGDLCEPFGVLPRVTDHSIVALTPVTFALIPLDALRSVARARPRVEEALWWDLLVSSAIEREHVVSLGRRTACERLAHLFCELHLRLKIVGLVGGLEYLLPITQADLGDLLGMSTVHVNRSLQELRGMGLISLRGRWLTIRDLNELREFSFFDEGHFHFAGSSSW
jgi:CRP-like cAMP-binding protein